LETFRFAKLKSWAAAAEAVTFKVSKDGDKHTLKGDNPSVTFQTEMVFARRDSYGLCCCTEPSNSVGLKSLLQPHLQAEDVCKLLKDYALWLAKKRKMEKKAKEKAKAKAEAEAAGGGD
jgi:hypothetical protein